MFKYGSQNSLHLLWVNLAQNQRYRPYVETRDIHEFLQRAEQEGAHFLTTVLPLLGKALDAYHSSQSWTPPVQFKLDCSSIPIFLGKAIKLALVGDSLAVDCVRQLSYVFYKLEMTHDPRTVDDCLNQFILVDRGVGSSLGDSQDRILQIHLEKMRRLIARVLCNADPRVIRPNHGGGATACHTTNWEKWHKLRYYKKLDDFFPYSDYFFYSPTHLVDRLGILEESRESCPQARICLVPKDSRGPRIISCEPAELMYIQQGLMRLLYETIEAHPLTSGQINFTDQSINRELARSSSIDDTLATLDLKDASDRVSLKLVELVFPPIWTDALKACRSESTKLPNGKIVELNKFAPMGSSCCFPVEALVFWASAQASIHTAHGIARGGNRVYVYGDDIITAKENFDAVVEGYTKIGLLTNLSKSFKEGPFRESCGGDYHNGYDVTPVRVRKSLSGQGTGLMTCADLCNEIIVKFGYEDARLCVSVIEHAIGYVYPRTDLPYPGSILSSVECASNSVFFKRRWNFNLQRFEHRIRSVNCRVSTKQLPEWEELLRKELSRGRSLTSNQDKYQNPLVIMDSVLKPGEYTEPRSVIETWTWSWLG